MPYVITTQRPMLRHREPGTVGVPNKHYLTPVSRRAVATLEEAIEVTDEAVASRFRQDGPAYIAASETARTLPESGGTVGPLPDGTTIQVESLSPLMLAARIPGDKGGIAALVRGCLDRNDWTPLLDAFNARQS